MFQILFNCIEAWKCCPGVNKGVDLNLNLLYSTPTDEVISQLVILLTETLSITKPRPYQTLGIYYDPHYHRSGKVRWSRRNIVQGWLPSEYSMMTSSNGNIFRVTGPLCGEFTGPGEFPTQRPVTRSFDVFFDLRLNKRLSKQPWGWWFETPSWSLWRHRNAQ